MSVMGWSVSGLDWVQHFPILLASISRSIHIFSLHLVVLTKAIKSVIKTKWRSARSFIQIIGLIALREISERFLTWYVSSLLVRYMLSATYFKQCNDWRNAGKCSGMTQSLISVVTNRERNQILKMCDFGLPMRANTSRTGRELSSTQKCISRWPQSHLQTYQRRRWSHMLITDHINR